MRLLSSPTQLESPTETSSRPSTCLPGRSAFPYAILVNTLDQLDTWLDLEKLTHLEELFAVEVRPSPAVEANVLLLAAGTREEPDVISTTIKLYMDKKVHPRERISDKVLQSGIIEKHMLEMLVRWGAFSENALDIIKNDTLRNATLAQLKKFAEELSVELKKEYPFRETMLDSPIGWPTSFTVMGEVVCGDQLITPGPPRSVHNIPAMRDDLLRPL